MFYDYNENHMVQGNRDPEDYYCPGCNETNPHTAYSVNHEVIGCEDCTECESQSYLESPQTCYECGEEMTPGSEDEEKERPDYYKIGNRYYCHKCVSVEY